MVLALLTLTMLQLVAGTHGRLEWPPKDKPCMPCKCTYSLNQQVGNPRSKNVMCQSLGLSFLPMFLPQDAEFLDLANNNLQYLDMDRLLLYRSLKGISVANNHIASLRSDIFYNLTRLQFLDFSGNNFANIPQEIFSGTRLKTLVGLNVKNLPVNIFWDLTPLRHLDITLHHTQVPAKLFGSLSLNTANVHFLHAQNIPESLFNKSNISMTTLYISGSNLTELSKDLYKALTVLQNIKISTKGMQTLPESIFREQLTSVKGDSRRLKEIKLDGVLSLPPTLFRELPFLECLEIHGLGSSLDSSILKNLSTLTSLDLSRNNISSLEEEWFENLYRLKSLNLSNTHQRQLDEKVFSHLGSIDVLDLSHNQISSIDSMCFSMFRMELDELDLSFNQLCKIPENLFQDMYDLKVLKLNHNCLADLPSALFSSLQSLSRLEMQNNNITALEYEHFQSLHDLVYLDLSYNQITRLGDYTFYDLNAVKNLDLSHNSIGALPSKAFSTDALLEHVILSGNPIHCECGMAPLLYLSAYIYTDIEGTCTEPEEFKGLHIKSLSIVEVCPESDLIVTTESALSTEDAEISPQFTFENRKSIEQFTIHTNTTTSLPTSWLPRPWKNWLGKTTERADFKDEVEPVVGEYQHLTSTSLFKGLVASVCSVVVLSLIIILVRKIKRSANIGESYIVNRR